MIIIKNLRLVLLNIRTLFQKDKITIFLFCMGIMISSATIMYSFGQVYSMADYLSEDQSYILTYPDGTVFESCKSSIEKSVNEISEIGNIKIVLNDDLNSDKSLFAMYLPWDYAIQFGSDFDKSDDPQIIIGTASGIYGEVGDTVTIDNRSYRVVGKRMLQFINQVNYASLHDDTNIYKLEIILSKHISSKKIESIGKKLEDFFPYAIIEKPRTIDYFSYFFGNVQFYIAIALSFLSIMNLMQLYRYLLNKRRTVYAIYQICGCDKKQGYILFLTELEILSIIPFFLSMFIYKVFIEKIIKDEFFYNIQLVPRQLFIITIFYILIQLWIFIPMLQKYSKLSPKQLKYVYEVG